MRDNLLFFGIAEGSSFDPAPQMANPLYHSEDTTITSGNHPSTTQTSDLTTNEHGGSRSANVPTYSSIVQNNQENCADKVFTFCDKVLHINTPRSKINIVRAHRVGKFIPGKVRPIVAKLESESKSLIKQSLKHVKLQHTEYNVSDQYPPEVKDRRKQLIPVMLDARKQGKRAVLVRDKLYIDNQLYGSD